MHTHTTIPTARIRARGPTPNTPEQLGRHAAGTPDPAANHRATHCPVRLAVAAYLRRALKTRGNTPKYGLIFHSSFIGRAKQRNKGRISRYLANKCSIASRIDCFMDGNTNVFGEKMREQVRAARRAQHGFLVPAPRQLGGHAPSALSLPWAQPASILPEPLNEP